MKTTNSAKNGAQGTPVSDHKCFANYHLTWAEFGLYTACKSIASEWGYLRFDGRKLALLAKANNSKESSKRSSKDTVYGYTKTLVKLGFFVVKRASTKNSEGKNDPSEYYVLEHDDWAKLHPGECDKIQCQIQEMVEASQSRLLAQPVQTLRLTSPDSSTDQSRLSGPIVLPTLLTDSTSKTLPTSPVQTFWTGALDLETVNPSAGARAPVPPQPVQTLRTGSLTDAIGAKRLTLLRLGRDSTGYFDLDSNERVSTDDWMRRKKKYQERQAA